MRRLVLWTMVGISALAPLAQARLGIARTRDGRTHEGTAFMDAAGTVMIVPTNAPRVRIPLDDLAQFTLRPETVPGATTVPQPGALPAPWVARHTGNFGVMGSAIVEGKSFVIQGSGVDACYFVHQPLTDTGEVVARVTGVENADPQAMAGVMLRQDLTEESSFIWLAATPADRGVLQTRVTAGKTSPLNAVIEIKAPCWLKLARSGQQITAQTSADGQKWQTVNQTRIFGDKPVFAGLAVASHSNHTLNRATFDNITVTTMPKENGSQAVTLRNGSTVAAALQSVDDISVKFTSYGHAYNLPRIDIARLHYRTVPAAKLAALFPGRRGVLLTNGDFYDGTITAIGNRDIKISSVIFGLREFRLDKEVALVVLRDLLPPATTWQIHLYDGTVLQTKTFTVDTDKLLMQDPAFGQFRVSLSDVAEITRQSN